MGVKMLFLALFLACAGGSGEYECSIDSVAFSEICGQAGQDAECGTDRGHAYLADLEAKDIGAEFDCSPARDAGDACVEWMNAAAEDATQATCDAISGTE